MKKTLQLQTLKSTVNNVVADQMLSMPEAKLLPETAGMQDAADEFFGKCEDMGLMENRSPITKPIGYEGFTVRAVQGSFGRYSYSETRTAYIDYENNDGDELSMTLEQWRAFLDELRRAALVLGVEL